MIQFDTIKKVEQHLRKAGVRNKDLLEEMCDHFLTEIEMQVANGTDLAKAEKKVLAQIQQKNYRPMNQHILFIHHKNQIIMSTLCAVFVGIFALLGVQNDSFKEPPSLWPIQIDQGEISSGFGKRRHPFTKAMKFHNGVDIRAEIGTPVLAPADAIVVEASYDKTHGHYIILKHDETYTTRYNHLSKTSVKKGDEIEKGAEIGKVGSTGMSTGPHLHYEVLKNNEHVDPMDYLKV
jgi:murein DD-endopeptidase MepM/ murein hydrolase activator NlpD